MKKLNSAIIGCGSIHTVHAEALVSSAHANLYAVCDIDEARASNSAEKYNCRAFSDYHEMLNDSNIDVVHICTPHYLHAPMAIAAMKSGKHVLCEKPIATSTGDAEEMIRVSRETGKKLGICFQNRYNTTSQKIKDTLVSGKAGKILGAKAFVTWHRDKSYYDSGEWRGTWEKEGGGVLINQSIHTLDLIQWSLGDIDRIKGHADTTLLQGIIEVEDTSDAVIVFKNGATALFYATNCYATDSPVEIEIVCENAVLKLSGDLIISYKNGEIEKVSDTDIRTGEKSYWGCGHAAYIGDFYSKVLNDEDIYVDGSEGITALRMIEAIYGSSKSGEFVKL